MTEEERLRKVIALLARQLIRYHKLLGVLGFEYDKYHLSPEIYHEQIRRWQRAAHRSGEYGDS